MRVLIVTDKHDTHIIDATDKDAALLEMFRIFDANQYYNDIEDTEEVLWKEARRGNMKSARLLVERRQRAGCEYEDRWRFADVIKPT